MPAVVRKEMICRGGSSTQMAALFKPSPKQHHLYRAFMSLKIKVQSILYGKMVILLPLVAIAVRFQTVEGIYKICTSKLVRQ
jgi:hypothetical protein